AAPVPANDGVSHALALGAVGVAVAVGDGGGGLGGCGVVHVSYLTSAEPNCQQLCRTFLQIRLSRIKCWAGMRASVWLSRRRTSQVAGPPPTIVPACPP